MAGIADFFAGFGAQPQQSAFDQADNGTVTADGTGSTYTPPSWLTSLQGLASVGASVYQAVDGSHTTNPSGTAMTAASVPINTAAAAGSAASSNKTWWIIGGLGAALLAVILFVVARRR